MKSYITEVKDGHHVVRMLTDKEMDTQIDSLPPEMKEELLNGQRQIRRVSDNGSHANHRIKLRDYPLGGSVSSRNVDHRMNMRRGI